MSATLHDQDHRTVAPTEAEPSLALPGLAPWRDWILDVARCRGLWCSRNLASRAAPAVAARFGVLDDGLSDSPPPWGDPTGEEAVMRVIGAWQR